MPIDTWFWPLAIAASLIVGASKGGLPLIGMLAVPLMSLVMSPIVAAGLLLPIYIVSDMYGLWIYRREYDKRIIFIIVPAAAIGIVFGWQTAQYTSEDVVKFLVGVIGLFYCLDAIVKLRRVVPAKPADVPRGIFWGALTGFTSYVSHSGAPPFQMYVLPQKLDKMVFAGTSTITFAIINLLKLPPYILLGQVTTDSLQKCLLLGPFSLLGAYVGYKLTKVIPQKLFFRTVEIALFLLSVLLIKESAPAVWSLLHHVTV